MTLREYLGKMRGSTGGSPPRVSNGEVLWSWIGALVGMGVLAWLNGWLLSGTDLTLMIGSFGASAVLVYGAVRSPLAQPRNLVGGHVVSALVGVTAWLVLHQAPELAAAVAVATAIAVMHLTRTLHPPGGATALIAVIGSDQIHNLGYWYVLVPATLGPLVLLLVGLVVNNIQGQFPQPLHGLTQDLAVCLPREDHVRGEGKLRTAAHLEQAPAVHQGPGHALG
jgi:CBS-domain-containing membrane protein